MYADSYACIFSHQMEAIVYLYDPAANNVVMMNSICLMFNNA